MKGDPLERLEELVVELIRKYRALKEENRRLLERLHDVEKKRAEALERLKNLLKVMEDYEKKG